MKKFNYYDIFVESYKGYDIYFTDEGLYHLYFIKKGDKIIKDPLISKRACKSFITRYIKRKEGKK